ncbi:MAG: hypothetical protein LUI60_06150 [Clostridia bacterium]|nr:hypothetical protein [Clostridia bacterium]
MVAEKRFCLAFREPQLTLLSRDPYVVPYVTPQDDKRVLPFVSGDMIAERR